MTPNPDSVAVLREMRATAYANSVNAHTEDNAAIHDARIRALDAAIAALSAQGEEPVAWAYRSEDPYDAGQWMLAGPTWEGEPRPNRREVVIPLYLHPAPPGSDAVTEEEISWLAMEAASFLDNEYQHGRARPNAHRIREHLRAALAARTGKGEA